MGDFHYRDGRLFAEQVPLDQLAARFGTPAFVYSRSSIESNWLDYDRAFEDQPHLICYSVKANGNLAILDLLARLGSGFDIVSAGELYRVLKAGGEASRVVFSGVGKTAEEMRQALEVGIRCFNVESRAELQLLNRMAGETGKIAPVSLRVNPDVDARTHPYIATGLRQSKFGIDINQAREFYQQAADLPHISVAGVDCHIGSQITSLEPYLDALERVLRLVMELSGCGIPLRHLNLGGGLGIRYHEESPPAPHEMVTAVRHALGENDFEVLLEPGRSIVGNAGVLLTEVLYLKHTDEKHFAVVDAGMNDLIRPALYDAWQDILPVSAGSDKETHCYDIVGPVCESGDFLGLDRSLALGQGDLLAVSGAGAYGMCMSSNYNSRPKPVEVLVDGDRFHLVRPRETLDDLIVGETFLPTQA